MRTTIDLPESVYQQSAQIAHLKGFSVEELIVWTLERALETEPSTSRQLKPVSFPLISSGQPGTLDLTDFDFDDLLV
ncbi:MAG TPA: hypothetical protein VFT88_05500 [Acidobacteriaceae bacterium]|jgi:hypothetical protein|nr:hypothetical protein [Acidobacteriaceae bacterium]